MLLSRALWTDGVGDAASDVVVRGQRKLLEKRRLRDKDEVVADAGRFLHDDEEPFDKIVKPQLQMREDVLRMIRLALEARSPMFVIVNNKAEGCSPATVEELARSLVDSE